MTGADQVASIRLPQCYSAHWEALTHLSVQSLQRAVQRTEDVGPCSVHLQTVQENAQ